ncbi:GPI-anchored protein LLG1-like [Iris pallida]|uniref:GPI-anchored protein LLG1-like n=1 Tax=Iris pallida TaxID=29817 RepID=A0AAX6E2L6_IRIPA|nr:GPI-anchored protein LLG1-like [Iris pallida]
MDPKRSFSLQALLFALLVGVAASATFISDGVFQHQGSIGRSLLQTKKSCPVNFEFANYTIITSKCKGPKYPADMCCSALKEFACPYADDINDGTNDCASTMFSYINLYGKYPPGLFSSECREGKNGLECPADAPQSADDSSAAHVTRSFFPLVTLVSGFLLGFLFS